MKYTEILIFFLIIIINIFNGYLSSNDILFQ